MVCRRPEELCPGGDRAQHWCHEPPFEPSKQDGQAVRRTACANESPAMSENYPLGAKAIGRSWVLELALVRNYRYWPIGHYAEFHFTPHGTRNSRSRGAPGAA